MSLDTLQYGGDLNKSTNVYRVISKVEKRLKKYGFDIPIGWKRLPKIGTMNSYILSVALDIYYTEAVDDVKMLKKGKNKEPYDIKKLLEDQYSEIREDITKKLSGDSFYVDMLIIQYLVYIIDHL